jgi:cofilin
MASGVGVDDEVVQKFNDLKLKHSHQYLVYKMSDDFKSIVVEKCGASGAPYNEFKSSLPAQDCRYGVFDLSFELPDGGKRNKIVFILWAPETAKIKSKMLYTSSKAELKKKLVGIATEVQATDASEIDEAAVLEKVKKE